MASMPWLPRPWIELAERGGDVVRNLAISADGMWLAALSGDTVHLMTMAGGHHSTFPGSGGLAFLPDGEHLLTVVDGGCLCLRRLSDGGIRTRMPHQGHPIEALALTPDGRVAASADCRNVHLWDVATGVEIRALAAHRRTMHSVAFSPDGRLMATRSFNEMRIFDVESGVPITDIPGLEGTPCAVAFSPGGRLVASGKDSRSVGLWNAADGSVVRAFSAGGHALAVAFSGDGRLLAAGGQDQQVTVWALEAMGGPERLEGPVRSVAAIVFSPAQDCILAAADCIHAWVQGGHVDRTVPPAPVFQACTLPGARGTQGLSLPLTVDDFCATLEDLPWFAHVGEPAPWDATCTRIGSWEEWPGPEDDGVSAMFDEEQAWRDVMVRFARTWGRSEVEPTFQRVMDRVTDRASARVPCDPEGDAWDGPTACAGHAGYCAALIAGFLVLGWDIPEDLQERWAWFMAGHWPCGLVAIEGERTRLRVL